MGTSLSRVCPGLAGRRSKPDDDDESIEKLQELFHGDARVQRESTESTAAPVEVVNVLSEELRALDAAAGTARRASEDGVFSPRSSSQVSTESVVLLDQGDLALNSDATGSAAQTSTPTTPFQSAVSVGRESAASRVVGRHSQEARMPYGARTMTMPAQARGVTTAGRQLQSPAVPQSAPLARSSPLVQSQGFRQTHLRNSLQMSSQFDRGRVYTR